MRVSKYPYISNNHTQSPLRIRNRVPSNEKNRIGSVLLDYLLSLSLNNYQTCIYVYIKYARVYMRMRMLCVCVK